jgi:hypothetical protein
MFSRWAKNKIEMKNLEGSLAEFRNSFEHKSIHEVFELDSHRLS